MRLNSYHIINKFGKQFWVQVMNEKTDSGEITYRWIIWKNGKRRIYIGMSEHFAGLEFKHNGEVKVKGRPFEHDSEDDLSITLLSCTHAICEIYYVDKGLARITEMEMIHSTPVNELINKQLYSKSCK